MSKPRLLDAFCGEGGAGYGYDLAGFDVIGVDTNKNRLARYPFECYQFDAIDFILKHGAKFDAIHMSPVCTGYSRGTIAIDGREQKYDRMIPAARAAARSTGRPYVIENVEGAARELISPTLLCGRMFGLGAEDEDGTPLVLDRHRLFESSILIMAPHHPIHDRDLQVAGSYGGARRDKDEARLVRRGGYVPGVDVQRRLLGTPWMSEKGCQLSIPPIYTQHIGAQLLDQLELAA